MYEAGPSCPSSYEAGPSCPSSYEAGPSHGITDVAFSLHATSYEAGPLQCSQLAIVTGDEGIFDLGTIIKAAGGSLGDLRRIVKDVCDVQRMQLLAHHSKPALMEPLHSHQVTKCGKTWSVTFQRKWLQQFPWLSVVQQCTLWWNLPMLHPVP